MKKILFGVFALLLVVATGCKKTEKEETTSLSLSKSGVKMAITTYDSEKSAEVATTDRFTITPKDGTYEITASVDDIVTWKISKNVVTLTAVNEGSTQLTITETKSKATATYSVEVVSVIESLSFTQATVSYPTGAEYLATLDTVDSVFTWTKENGEQVALRAFLVDATVDLYSDGFFINDNGEYAGSAVGYIATFPAKAWFAPEGMNADRGWESSASLSTGVWSTQSTGKSKVMTPGTFTNGAEAFDHVKTAIENFNIYMAEENEAALETFRKEMTLADTMAFHGAQLIRMIYMPLAGGYGYDYMPAAVIPAGLMQLAWNDNSMYMYSVPGAEMYLDPLLGDNGWGVKVEFNEISKQYTLKSTGFEFGKQIHYRHTPTSGDDDEAAPARKAMQLDRHVLNFKPKNAFPLR